MDMTCSVVFPFKWSRETSSRESRRSRRSRRVHHFLPLTSFVKKLEERELKRPFLPLPCLRCAMKAKKGRKWRRETCFQYESSYIVEHLKEYLKEQKLKELRCSCCDGRRRRMTFQRLPLLPMAQGVPKYHERFDRANKMLTVSPSIPSLSCICFFLCPT